jgi:hypothetical protein
MGTMMLQGLHPMHEHEHFGINALRDWNRSAQVLFIGSLSVFIVIKVMDAYLAASEAETLKNYRK